MCGTVAVTFRNIRVIARGAQEVAVAVDSAAVEPSTVEIQNLAEVLPLDPVVRTGVLDNGLRYLIRENDNPGSRVDMRLTIDAGSGRQEPDSFLPELLGLWPEFKI